MTTLERINFVLEAMLRKAELVYLCSTENYPDTRGPRRGIAAVSIQVDSDTHPHRWLTLSDNFGEVCYRDPKQLNGRDIDLGGSNEGVLFGKIAYSRRTMRNSGCDAREVKEGESFWRGNIFEASDPYNPKCVTFGFSGFTELDDEEVAKAGRKAYRDSFGK
jgi:hypothetical protein